MKTIFLPVLLIMLTLVPGAPAYLGEDMTDEEFEMFVDAHADFADSVVEFVAENKDAFAAGAIGGVAGLALKGISTHPVVGGMLIGGGVELVKTIYKNTVSGKAAKEDAFRELEQKLEAVVREINEMKAGNHNQPSLGDFSSGYGHEARGHDGGESDPRSSSCYTLNGHTYTTDGRDAGPHRGGYREYRDPSTRDAQDMIDRIVSDSLRDRSKDNYVERRKD